MRSSAGLPTLLVLVLVLTVAFVLGLWLVDVMTAAGSHVPTILEVSR